jgi:hypothetical protein
MPSVYVARALDGQPNRFLGLPGRAIAGQGKKASHAYVNRGS